MKIVLMKSPKALAPLLRKLFGGFLVFVGLWELFGAHKRDKKDK